MDMYSTLEGRAQNDAEEREAGWQELASELDALGSGALQGALVLKEGDPLRERMAGRGEGLRLAAAKLREALA